MPDRANFTDGHIFVDFQRTGNAIQDMELQTNQIISWLQQLKTELNELQQSWIGDDADVYRVKQEAWNNAAEEMAKLVKKHGMTLDDVSNVFYQNQQQSKMRWESLR
ncbi:WXG100 family type VII secretion target [Streptomyces sp. NPDC051954]|uniref:WXG100 family type VII secretion target n=1 Tax=unclassified Streptomyces TaxID=2593676 RepID=UPI003425E0B0